ncbi:MAG TPA: threonine/homoserine exporter RhtA [Steroidobacteraceae bacterium]|nr:threonine/homoserine exporter RhtA [Steroidobacteraceae bacterium]
MRALPRRMSTLLPIAFVLAAMASVQMGASIAKTMFPAVGPVGMVAVRIALGTIVLCLLMRPWRARITAGTWRPLAVYGVTLGVMNLFYYLSLSRVPLGIAVAIEFTGPLAVAVFSSRRLLDFCWILLAAAGLLLLLPVARVGVGIDPLGGLFALAAGACWALYIIYGQRAGANHGTQTVALGSIISAFMVVPIGLIARGTTLLAPSILLPGLAVGILSTALPYTLEMYALTRLPARTFGILMSIEPAFGALLGVVYLHEWLTTIQWTAIALVIVASIGATASARQTIATVA